MRIKGAHDFVCLCVCWSDGGIPQVGRGEREGRIRGPGEVAGQKDWSVVLVSLIV